MESSNGLPAALSNTCSLFSGIFQRIVIFPVDFYCAFPMDVQSHSPMEFHLCDFWRVIVCPDVRAPPRLGAILLRGTSSRYLFIYIYIHTHTHTHIYLHICTYIHIYIYVYVYMYLHIHIYVYTQRHIYVYVCMCIYIYMYIHIYYTGDSPLQNK